MLALAAIIVLVALNPTNVQGSVLRANNELQPPSSQNEEFADFVASRVNPQRSFMNYNAYNPYNNQNLTECRSPSPCGWYMYHPVERTFFHFLQVCRCINGLRCLADRDDVSISSWVYMCKVAPPGTPDLPPGMIPPV